MKYGCGLRLHGYSTLSLHLQIVQHLILSSFTANGARQLQQTIGQRALAMIHMRNYAEIPYTFHRHLSELSQQCLLRRRLVRLGRGLRLHLSHQGRAECATIGRHPSPCPVPASCLSDCPAYILVHSDSFITFFSDPDQPAQHVIHTYTKCYRTTCELSGAGLPTRFQAAAANLGQKCVHTDSCFKCNSLMWQRKQTKNCVFNGNLKAHRGTYLFRVNLFIY